MVAISKGMQSVKSVRMHQQYPPVLMQVDLCNGRKIMVGFSRCKNVRLIL